MPKTFLRSLAAALVSVCALAQEAPQTPVHEWWRERPPGSPLNSPDAHKLPLIAVQGNRFVDPQGNRLLLRGVSISDPTKLAGQGHWNREYFVHVQQMGARVVRIPVHPVAWRERTPAGYLPLLDQAVAWSTELGMYVDIDWHSIGNLTTGLFQDPMYDTSLEETFGFWRTIARHFAHNNTVAFYELFNEPTTYSNQLGPVSWGEWKKINEELIALIRAYGPGPIPLVAGFDWAYDLTPLHEAPIAAEGIAYSVHPYAHKRPKPWEPKWDEDFGFAAARYPIIATEFGFSSQYGGQGDYGPAIIHYLESKGMSWFAWCFDPEWGPSLLRSWNLDLSESGEFFERAMKAGGAPSP